MGCVLCNLIQLSEKDEPFPSESARQHFWNELAVDIAQNHPELVEAIMRRLSDRRRTRSGLNCVILFELRRAPPP